MTNESAIEYLKSMKWIYQNDDVCAFSSAESVLQALDMAIEALSALEEDENPCDACQEFDCYGCEYKR